MISNQPQWQPLCVLHAPALVLLLQEAGPPMHISNWKVVLEPERLLQAAQTWHVTVKPMLDAENYPVLHTGSAAYGMNYKTCM
jgi:hypothetical protein